MPYQISVNLDNFSFWDQICPEKHFRVGVLGQIQLQIQIQVKIL